MLPEGGDIGTTADGRALLRVQNVGVRFDGKEWVRFGQIMSK